MKKFFVTFLLVLAGSVFAAPVYRMPVVRIQPNGDTLHLFVTGDEYYHRLHDADDYTIVQHPQTSNLVLCVYDLSEWISEVSSFSATKTGDRFTSIVAVGNNDLVAEDSSTFYSLSNQKMRCDIRFIGCSENGNEIIAQISDEEPMVTVNHCTVTVDDPKCRAVELYDITGRRIAASAGKANSRLMAPSPGVYLLRIDGLPAKKLIIL